MADAGRAPATIERALAAHRTAGAGTLRTDGPRQVLRSYRRDRATTGTGVRVRKAAQSARCGRGSSDGRLTEQTVALVVAHTASRPKVD